MSKLLATPYQSKYTPNPYPERTCGTCMWFYRMAALLDDGTWDYMPGGSCRKTAPMQVPQHGNDSRFYGASVGQNDWCGAWEVKP